MNAADIAPRNAPRAVPTLKRRFDVMKLSIRSLRRSSIAALTLSLFGTTALADAPDGGAPAFTARPIAVTVLTSNPRTAEGLIFLTPTNGAPGAVQGKEIVDGQGRPVWF